MVGKRNFLHVGIPGAGKRNNSTFMTCCNKAGQHRQNFAYAVKFQHQILDFNKKKAGTRPAFMSVL
jgi:hypothetical protein